MHRILYMHTVLYGKKFEINKTRTSSQQVKAE